MWRRDNGLTLIEVMVATFITLFGLAALLTAFTSARRLSAIQAEQERAVHEVREVTEMILSRDYYDSSLNVGSHYFSELGITGDSHGSFYTVSFNSDVSKYGSENVKDIDVYKYWVEAGGTITSTLSIKVSMSRVIH